MKVLLTGFQPFNNETVNPAIELLKYYNNKEDIITLPLNVEYNFDAIKVINEIKNYNPDVIILLGQAGGRKKVMVESVALNVHHATIPDNAQNKLTHEIIFEDGPIAYQTNVDLFSLLKKVNDENFDISYHAGTFVCNDLYYQTLHYINTNNLLTKCIFIHLPYLDSQVVTKPNMPSMTLEKMKSIIDKVIDALC